MNKKQQAELKKVGWGCEPGDGGLWWTLPGETDLSDGAYFTSEQALRIHRKLLSKQCRELSDLKTHIEGMMRAVGILEGSVLEGLAVGMPRMVGKLSDKVSQRAMIEFKG